MMKRNDTQRKRKFWESRSTNMIESLTTSDKNQTDKLKMKSTSLLQPQNVTLFDDHKSNEMKY